MKIINELQPLAEQIAAAIAEEKLIANCGPCSECDGSDDHHWMEEYDEWADEMFLGCKHCPAHKPMPDDWGDDDD